MIKEYDYNAPVAPKKCFYATYVKRLIDIIICTCAFLVLSPLLLVVYILELCFHGAPAVYKTTRPGKDGKPFHLYKFRSMTNERGEDGLLLHEEERLTKFGRFLRKTSIDELPELINIIKGDMSIIGPRPLLVEYLPLYNERHAHRHDVRPGLCCLKLYKKGEPHLTTWTWGDQFESDIEYVENISFIYDVRMVFAVIKKVFSKDESRTSDTRVPFIGTNLDETRSRAESGVDVRYDSVCK